MCHKPIHLKTNVKNFHPSYDKLFHTVSCGKCSACRAKMETSWNIRAYYEWKNAKLQGGLGLFFTLTYDNINLPTLPDTETPAFSKTHIKRFLYRLRSNLRYHYGRQIELRYLITSEYGGTTHRPHYHVEMYFYESLSAYTLNKIIRKSWPHGFSYFGKNFGEILSFSACTYVTKYITKDITFHDVNSEYEKYYTLAHGIDKFKDVKREFYPFHLQSTQFGACIADFVSRETLELGFVPMPCKTGVTMKPIPLYLDRKLFYYVDKKEKSYRLTHYGISVRLKRLTNNRLYLADSIEKLYSSLSDWLNADAVELINCYLLSDFTLETFKPHYDYIYSKYTTDELIEYLTNYRDVTYMDDTSITPHYNNTLLNQRDRLSKHFNYIPTNYPSSDVSSDKEQFNNISKYLYNDIEPIEEYAKLYYATLYAYGTYLDNTHTKKQQFNEKVKLLKQLHYAN